jgi:hypothetical protein
VSVVVVRGRRDAGRGKLGVDPRHLIRIVNLDRLLALGE